MRLKKPDSLYLLAFACAVGFGRFGHALSISEDFSSIARRDSSTLVWNQSSHQLHPPVLVKDYNDGGLQSKNFDIGTGQHGTFTASTYANFSQGGDVSGNIIRINTDTYSALEFTTFNLASGWTLQPTGSSPLVIRVQGDVFIAGIIYCSGDNGENMNGLPAVATQGGAGRCGGGDGGNGGTTGLAAQSGQNGGPIITNGAGPGVDGPTAGGGATVAQAGGGGGGAYAVSRGLAYDPTAGAGVGGGSVGEMGRDNDFDYSGGGFGGGGGAAYNAGGAGQNSAGGAGGGGGGYVFITSGGNISITGSVYANGGNGGSSGGTHLAGGGGGGGGGSIAMFAAGTIWLDGGAVTISADRGSGGTSPANNGGDGSAGRTFLVDFTDYADLINGASAEYPVPLVADVGNVRYQTGTFTANTVAIDTLNTLPSLVSTANSSTLVGTSTLTVEVAKGSEAGFTPATWIDVTTVPFDLDRFIRVQITLNSSGPTADQVPATVSSLSFTMSGYQQGQFNFVGACGRAGNGGGRSSRTTIPWFVILWLIPFCMARVLTIADRIARR